KEKGAYDVIHPKIHVNMAQSANDAFATAVHLATIHLLENLRRTMHSLHESAEEEGAEVDEVIQMGRTHLEVAVPTRLGQEVQSYGRVLSRDMKRLESLYDSLLEVNLGATAVGTGLNADPDYMKKAVEVLSEETGIPFRNADHLIDATQNTDAYTAI